MLHDYFFIFSLLSLMVAEYLINISKNGVKIGLFSSGNNLITVEETFTSNGNKFLKYSCQKFRYLTKTSFEVQ